MKARPEVMVPVWPHYRGFELFGGKDYSSYNDDSKSAWISLRCIDRSDKYSWMSDELRAVGDIGIYVWFSSDGKFCAELKLHDVHSLSIRECETRLKALKRLTAKAKGYPLGCFITTSDIHAELTKLFAALGIRTSVMYHGINVDNTYQLIGIATKAIADVLQAKFDAMQKA